jgi:hypothetical protein
MQRRPLLAGTHRCACPNIPAPACAAPSAAPHASPAVSLERAQALCRLLQPLDDEGGDGLGRVADAQADDLGVRIGLLVRAPAASNLRERGRAGGRAGGRGEACSAACPAGGEGRSVARWRRQAASLLASGKRYPAWSLAMFLLRLTWVVTAFDRGRARAVCCQLSSRAHRARGVLGAGSAQGGVIW